MDRAKLGKALNPENERILLANSILPHQPPRKGQPAVLGPRRDLSISERGSNLGDP